MRHVLFSPPDITEAEISEVVDALKSGWITTGPKTKKLEQLVAERCHTSKAVCLNSNTACAEITLRILGIGIGDEVIVPAYTYTATASVVEHVGARLVMIDCEHGKFTMDYEKLEAAITERTKAIISVDLFGIPCGYDTIFDIVERKKNLFHPNDNPIQKALNRVIVMADGAHSFGASYKKFPIGSVADFTNFSFHAVKNLTTAEGGAVVWRDIEGIDNDELYHQYMLLSLHGQSKDALAKTKLGAWEYDIIGPWYKCNMTDVCAGIGLGQIKRYDEILSRRKEIIDRYNKGLKGLPITVVTHYTSDIVSSGHLYIINLNDKDAEQRNKFIEKMAGLGVATNVHYKPLPMHTGYKKLGFKIEDYPNAYEQFKNVVTLPLHTCLSDEDVDYVIECVKECLK
ncbi:cys/Met metabolism PLP-dependent enzyme family protein [Parabacteroides distasonis str. 3776 D15 iv]|uniref:Cys/Met metabolism PLP-dependent enzyme family protein n=1 Tax=Parabacteroides distasonis str. 3776 D15 i TaxID=1339342 RepID=A0AB34L8M9_PARDI|nr:DegT/DnrJ/EryC1/StrS family aminotransferase [Parabacteroides distasonis]KDS37701.1 cys/Met metabolism PLP-dependent enzyme family protein [Parabacteroides distasonis str. 3776 D15 i]KDS48366.1 cys/Met metabolism PLP-dependent enzyme family protein [Parabacteroides distasonis str. 3776 Po2 i]KDS69868.1 cys/Met metabolism PLP-dependent enzyme family protein [Parabacteroides distasonis str. 3776 D15 iv]UVR27786.1 DegT/DnrJ/EryC1/StrS family aminotransferase [Parabacteroides distasonis]